MSNTSPPSGSAAAFVERFTAPGSSPKTDSRHPTDALIADFAKCCDQFCRLSWRDKRLLLSELRFIESAPLGDPRLRCFGDNWEWSHNILLEALYQSTKDALYDEANMADIVEARYANEDYHDLPDELFAVFQSSYTDEDNPVDRDMEVDEDGDPPFVANERGNVDIEHYAERLACGAITEDQCPQEYLHAIQQRSIDLLEGHL